MGKDYLRDLFENTALKQYPDGRMDRCGGLSNPNDDGYINKVVNRLWLVWKAAIDAAGTSEQRPDSGPSTDNVVPMPLATFDTLTSIVRQYVKNIGRDNQCVGMVTTDRGSELEGKWFALMRFVSQSLGGMPKEQRDNITKVVNITNVAAGVEGVAGEYMQSAVLTGFNELEMEGLKKISRKAAEKATKQFLKHLDAEALRGPRGHTGPQGIMGESGPASAGLIREEDGTYVLDAHAEALIQEVVDRRFAIREKMMTTDKQPVIDIQHEGPIAGVTNGDITGSGTLGEYADPIKAKTEFRQAYLGNMRDHDGSNTRPAGWLAEEMPHPSLDDTALGYAMRMCVHVTRLLDKRTLERDTNKDEQDKQFNIMVAEQQWAEGLINQLPSTHYGRNSWLLNHGSIAGCEVEDGAMIDPKVPRISITTQVLGTPLADGESTPGTLVFDASMVNTTTGEMWRVNTVISGKSVAAYRRGITMQRVYSK